MCISDKTEGGLKDALKTRKESVIFVLARAVDVIQFINLKE